MVLHAAFASAAFPAQIHRGQVLTATEAAFPAFEGWMSPVTHRR
jgi:hypothetical protein